MALTDKAAKLAKAQSTPYKLADEKGLYLFVHPRGSKYWRMKYRLAGKEKTLSLGVYPEVSLAEARKARDRARGIVSQGNDPISERRSEKRRIAFEAANTFEAVATEWYEAQCDRWTPGHAEAVMDSLKSNAFPVIGNQPIAEIGTLELLDALRPIEKRGSLEVASRVAQRCGAVFRYAVQTGRIKTNPAIDLRGALKTRKVEHRPALMATDLPGFLAKLENYDGYIVTRHALRFLLLTFVRPGELRGARWDEIDFDKHEWRIPAERMKMGEAHIVPLSRQALDVLDAVRPITGTHELVFASQIEPRKPMSENTLLYAMYRMGYHSRATAHGFRATASTILNETGFKPDVIERQLAHAERNKVRAAYHRAQYLEERHKMMQWWANYLDGVGKGKVIRGKFGKTA